MGEEEIVIKLNLLDQKRSRLVEAGLLEPSHEPTLPTKRFETKRPSVYWLSISPIRKKLAVFDDMLSRIELIRSIVDSRFLQKTIGINRTDGFIARSRDGRPLDLSGLSSGEQHELVLLHELLFRAKPNTLILIDEPELSLHIAWQQQFLRDLLLNHQACQSHCACSHSLAPDYPRPVGFDRGSRLYLPDEGLSHRA